MPLNYIRKSEVVIPANSNDNIPVNFEIEINEPADTNLHFALVVPNNSGLIPGDNVFIVPNPVTIDKGNKHVKARAVLITKRIKAGTKNKLIIGLMSGEAKIKGINQFSVVIKKD